MCDIIFKRKKKFSYCHKLHTANIKSHIRFNDSDQKPTPNAYRLVDILTSCMWRPRTSSQTRFPEQKLMRDVPSRKKVSYCRNF